MVINGWMVTTSDDGQYLYVQLDGSPGQIHIKADDDGFVVGIWNDNEPPQVVSSTYAEYTALDRE